jgi:integrase
MRRFSLFQRGKVFYVQFFNPDTNSMSTAKSTGAKTRNEAAVVVAEWLRSGVPSGRQGKPRLLADKFTVDAILAGIRKAPLDLDDAARIVAVLQERGLIERAVVKGGPSSTLLVDFLRKFWDYQQSPYVKEKLAHGQSIGRRHCYESTNRVNAYWKVAFEGRRLIDVARQDLKAFSMALSEKGLSPATINKVLAAGVTAFHWAFTNAVIPSDPGAGLVHFSGVPKRRDILNTDEASKLFQVAWKEERARVGNLLAMTTGMRAGEILALRPEDIGQDRLFVRHSWSEKDGLKKPKNGEERIVHLLPQVRSALLSLISENPHFDKQFVFYSAVAESPTDSYTLIKGLQRAMEAIGISEAERVDRNLVFHSWRHFYSTAMADRVGERTMKLTGHKTTAVFESYANHASEKDFKALEDAADQAFGKVIPFHHAISG